MKGWEIGRRLTLCSQSLLVHEGGASKEKTFNAGWGLARPGRIKLKSRLENWDRLYRANRESGPTVLK